MRCAGKGSAAAAPSPSLPCSAPDAELGPPQPEMEQSSTHFIPPARRMLQIRAPRRTEFSYSAQSVSCLIPLLINASADLSPAITSQAPTRARVTLQTGSDLFCRCQPFSPLFPRRTIEHGSEHGLPAPHRAVLRQRPCGGSAARPPARLPSPPALTSGAAVRQIGRRGGGDIAGAGRGEQRGAFVHPLGSHGCGWKGPPRCRAGGVPRGGEGGGGGRAERRPGRSAKEGAGMNGTRRREGRGLRRPGLPPPGPSRGLISGAGRGREEGTGSPSGELRCCGDCSRCWVRDCSAAEGRPGRPGCVRPPASCTARGG